MATSRTRVISQSKAVFVGPTGIQHNAASGYIPDQLHRIDTFSFDIDIAGARTDIREFGQLARIASVTMSDINPSLSFGYYLMDGENEARLGFNDDGLQAGGTPVSQFVSGIISEDANKKQKNIYVLTTKEGADAFNSGQLVQGANISGCDVVSFGNVTLNSYTASFAVGDIPRADIEAEASNIVFTTGTCSGFQQPSINQAGVRQAGTVALIANPDAGDKPKAPSTGDMSFPVLKPDDITITFSNPSFDMGGTNFSDMHVQSASIDVPLARGNIEALGKARAVAKPLEFPIDVTMSFSSLLKNFDSGTLDLVLTGTAGNQKTDITLSIGNDDSVVQSKFVLKNAQLDSQAFSQGLDDNETVDLTFSAQIGGPNTTNQGLFYSGSANPTVDATGATNSYTK
jgi:hypothetical protein